MCVLIPLFLETEGDNYPSVLGACGRSGWFYTPFLKEEKETHQLSIPIGLLKTRVQPGIVLISRFYMFPVANREEFA